jgi:hypothetical protein
MPILGTERKTYTDFVKGVSTFENEVAADYNFARVGVKGSTVIQPLAIPLVWNNADSAFEVYVAQTIPTDDSSLPNGSPVCFVVGQKEGRGVNKADVTLSGTAQDLTVLFRGQAVVSKDEIVWGAADTGAKAAFLMAVEKQDIAAIESADAADPRYFTA